VAFKGHGFSVSLASTSAMRSRTASTPSTAPSTWTGPGGDHVRAAVV